MSGYRRYIMVQKVAGSNPGRASRRLIISISPIVNGIISQDKAVKAEDWIASFI